MKSLINLITLIFLVLNLSCKDTNVEKKPSVEYNKVVPKQLVIDFNFRTDKQDEFTISMLNIEVDKLQKKSIEISEYVMPSTNYDKIIAKFDSGNLSKDIIVNLGNEVEKSVEIKNISISYGDNAINLSNPSDFEKHLVFNKFIERDSLSKILKTKRLNGRLNPTIRVKRHTINLLKK